MSVATSARTRAAVVLVIALLALARPARAQDPTTMGDALLGIGSGICTLVYTPVKLAYAATGVGVGSLVWLFSAGNTDTMNSVLKITAGGDYVVTPEHLRGLRVVRFVGRAKRG